MFRLELDTGSVEILQNGTAHRGGSIERKDERSIRNLLLRDGLMRSKAMVGRKNENQRVRTHVPAGQISHVLFRSHESGIKPAPLQRTTQEPER
jgi:hypothetical protein